MPRHWDPASFFLDPSVSYSDDTLLNRHTVTVSLDPANKQRDDGCRLAINIKKFTK
ncbi:hypothetical protein [Wolbachia endosymbiont (group A) of Agelastica alni]|uniref:hypothetical protein n=1 Tax=Wolbachia endosymbiont (group A) of Agelastica alni TaxID=3066130 RepID=UPI0031330666